LFFNALFQGKRIFRYDSLIVIKSLVINISSWQKGMREAIESSGVKITAIDLFCGAGGLTHGLGQAGIDVRLGVDVDPACEYPYRSNNDADFLLRSVEELSLDDLGAFYDHDGFRLLAGCAPCQTFSTYNHKATESDDRWWLLLHFSRLVDELRPDFVTMENVPGLEVQGVFLSFVNALERLDYNVWYKVVNCDDYGLPQMRKRLVLLASRHGVIELMSPTVFCDGKRSDVRSAIGDLPVLGAGASDPEDPLHRASSLSELNLRRIRASRQAGTWQDWPDELLSDCHRRISGKTYQSVYGRMAWHRQAPTITTQFYGYGNGRFGHPEQDRALSLREGAILQSFPRDYKFVRPGERVFQKSIGRLIGNAVPVRLGEVIGASLQTHVLSLDML